jgi:TonB family protein
MIHRLSAGYHAPAKIAGLLRPPIAYGGLYFFDPACTRQFPGPMVIQQANADAFAKCLATLPFVVSPRFTQLFDGDILTYEPGIEVDVRFDKWRDGGALGFIGYSQRTSLKDGLPTIDPVAFDKLRTDQVPLRPDDFMRGLLDAQAKTADDGYLYSWIKVCADAEGNVTSTHVRETSSLDANDVFLAAIKDWKLKPFVIGGHAVPICSTILMTYPSSKRPEKEVMPLPDPAEAPDEVLVHPDVKLKRISGEKNIAPYPASKRLMAKTGLLRVIGIVDVCVDTTGHVTSTRTIKPTGFPSYDDRLAEVTRSWVFEPPMQHGRPTTACGKFQFVYNQD